MAQTPIKCFVRLDNLFFTEDWAGTRTPIALACGDGQGDFLAWSLERCHNVAVLPWDYTDPPMPTVAADETDKVEPSKSKVDHSPGCLGGRGEVSKTCPVCTAERQGIQLPLVDLDALARAGRDEHWAPGAVDESIALIEAHSKHQPCTGKDCPVCRKLLEGKDAPAAG